MTCSDYITKRVNLAQVVIKENLAIVENFLTESGIDIEELKKESLSNIHKIEKLPKPEPQITSSETTAHKVSQKVYKID